MEIIIEEYLLSDGEVDKNELFFALENIKEPERYFKNIELNLINEKFREG